MLPGHGASNSHQELSRPQGRAAGDRAWQTGRVTHVQASRLGSESKGEGRPVFFQRQTLVTIRMGSSVTKTTLSVWDPSRKAV